MPRVTKFEPRPTDKQSVQKTEGVCGYHSFAVNGKTWLQLDTYGSTERKFPGKTSQTIQLDESAARALYGVLRGVFGPL